ncbi:aspartate--tRNA ligase dps1 [Rhizophlyctis rosea]|uniref:Aspartate--tRNA ligase, cytoplasmic n=1 Tax=Rhizophlyctis rosea TaxID=64517 RepID=A0AAD5SJA4_9FUNG|nr:aspartate--tRNA ligase dps1 [Rhizophlyctis rosea]
MSSEATVQDITAGTANVVLGEDGKPLSKAQLKKREKEQEKERRKAEVAARLATEKAAREAAEPDHSANRYGKLPMNQSQAEYNRESKRTKIVTLGEANVGQTILLSARVQTSRPTGAKKCFVTLRQRTVTVQGVVTVDEETVSKQMLKFVNGISVESLVLVEATVVKALQKVTSCTVQDVELKITKLHVISEAARLPFTLEDASRPITELEESSAEAPVGKVTMKTRLDNRVIDLRTITNQAVFRMQHGVSRLFREYLESKDFTEIHTPKLIGAASEGGANVFKLNYFNTSKQAFLGFQILSIAILTMISANAFLAQSPQLYKQMVICSDFERVYEIAPVFRAENSQTHRHMTEFMGLDLEMSFEEHYHEVLDVLDGLFAHIFEGLKTRYAAEIEVIKRQFPFDDFVYKPTRLEFPQAVAMLRKAGIEIGDHDDLSTESERVLGRLVKEQYGTDFFMLDKFPLAVRPFYTMPDPNKPGYSNSYDFFIRGEEILSGAQRIHDSAFLEERAKVHQVDPATIQPYLDAFKYGAPPHAGGGIGLERVVMLYLNLGNIRRTSLFPRDPTRLTP